MLASPSPLNPWLRAADLLCPPPDPGVEAWLRIARPNQLAPPGGWFVWNFMAGRGVGKSRSGTEWLNGEVRGGRSGPQVLVAGRTPADVRDYLLFGHGGLLRHHPDIDYQPSKRLLVWPNGVQGLIRSGANPEEFRGFSGSRALLDELAAWDYPSDCWSNLLFGLREAEPPPRIAVTTTPRPIPVMREIIAMPGTVTVRASSWENRANLSEVWVENVLKRYEGTRLGRQEIDAEMLEDMEGALWTLKMIDDLRVHPEQVPPLLRIVVGVDPQGVKKDGSETGIVAVGIAANGHLYVLEDGSINGSPSEWATRAIALYQRHEADRIIGEVNFGGDMVEATVRAVDSAAAYSNVHASRGKQQRAEPVVARYEQGTAHHVGTFPALEDEMANWVPTSRPSKSRDGSATSRSPNRMDALVWAVTALIEPPDSEKHYGVWGR